MLSQFTKENAVKLCLAAFFAVITVLLFVLVLITVFVVVLVIALIIV